MECALTANGEHFLEELSGVRLEAVRLALAALTPRELSGFHVLLRRDHANGRRQPA